MLIEPAVDTCYLCGDVVTAIDRTVVYDLGGPESGPGPCVLVHEHCDREYEEDMAEEGRREFKCMVLHCGLTSRVVAEKTVFAETDPTAAFKLECGHWQI